MTLDLAANLATPIAIVVSVLFGAGKVTQTIAELRRAVDRLEQVVDLIDQRTRSVEERVSKLEGKCDN